jgi:hypothetical protein
MASEHSRRKAMFGAAQEYRCAVCSTTTIKGDQKENKKKDEGESNLPSEGVEEGKTRLDTT